MPKFLQPLIMGNPILYKNAEKIRDVFDPQIKEDIENMMFTIQSLGERVGLAAPQVGILKRIVVFRVPAKPVHSRYQSISDLDQPEIPWTAMINPSYKPIDSEMVPGMEVCVSVPGIMGEVHRYKSISYSYLDEKGNYHEHEAHGFHARLIQHELDHLDGILFPMRVKDMKTLAFEQEVIMKEAV